LPSKDELNLLYQQQSFVSGFPNDLYWSSSEVDGSNAWLQFFGDGYQDFSTKDITFAVRAIRAF